MTDVTRVYRVLICELPAGSSEEGWQPEGWEKWCEEQGWDQDYVDRADGGVYAPKFHWPRRRHFFTRQGAERVVKIFEQWGAQAIVQAGDVAWT